MIQSPGGAGARAGVIIHLFPRNTPFSCNPGREERGQYGGRNVSGVRMCLEIGQIGDCMVDAMYKEQGCGWR